MPKSNAAVKPAFDTLIIATHNTGKLNEIHQLLGNSPLNLLSAQDIDLPEPEETGTTFIANAELKAKAAYEATGKPCVADDSGLCVDALNGEPGIYTARWAGRDYQMGMQKLEAAIKETGSDDNNAHFVCAVAFVDEAGQCHSFESTCHGTLTFPPRGPDGFGYDPIFVPNGENRTFAEMDADEKFALSHRGKAFRKLVADYLS